VNSGDRPVLVTWFRHLLAIAILPFTVTVLIPTWIARRSHTLFAIGQSAIELAIQLVGLAALAVGLTLFVASLRHFAVHGRGTLAPWDPPRQLVIAGPYRYVRNPMISGVVFTLAAEALVLLSRPHVEWMLTFLAINLVYIPLFEEPQLESRFGDAYREYKRRVPRVIPRLRPL
jgi:protein-S-isoprenylcysteine O-methyltransferase Ste14